MNGNMKWAYGFIGAALVVIAGFALFTFDSGPVEVVQRGFRGTAMEVNYKPDQLAEYLKANEVPEVIPDLGNDGPKASEIYQNVQVLGHLSEGEFTRTMLAITSWVAPEQGCTYCHNPENMASEEIYTYKVARKMLQMTQTINADWNTHVGGVGVTCYTCHRGNPVPAQIWFHPEQKRRPGGLMMASDGQNTPSAAADLASLPSDPFTPYLENNHPIRVQGASALPRTDGPRNSIKETEWTWALMIHYSTSLGVNCTYCHNTRAFSDWEQSSPARQIAYYAAPMVRDLNANYLKVLQDVFPDYRLGPTGDVAKVNCGTCHQGVYKPLLGANMIKDYPELLRPAEKAAAVAPPAPATTAMAAPQ